MLFCSCVDAHFVCKRLVVSCRDFTSNKTQEKKLNKYHFLFDLMLFCFVWIEINDRLFHTNFVGFMWLYLLFSLCRCYPFLSLDFLQIFSRVFEFQFGFEVTLVLSLSLFYTAQRSQCNNITISKRSFFRSLWTPSFLYFLRCCHTIWHLTTNFNQHTAKINENIQKLEIHLR